MTKYSFDKVIADKSFNSISFGTVSELILDNESLYGKKVAIHCHPSNFAKIFVALDGLVSLALLVPYKACEGFIDRAERTLNLDLVVSDGLVALDNWQTEKLNLNFSDALRFKLANNLNNKLTTVWVIATSGTTGTPKFVAHNIESLSRTTPKNTKNIELSWGLLYDPARFAGLQVVLNSILNNQKLIIPNPDSTFEDQINYLAINGCNALSATPSLWKKVLMTVSSNNLNLKQITLGGEIVDQKILNTLASKYPDANITHIYASTEAGVGFSVKDKKAGFPKSWLQTGVRDVALKISSQNTLCLNSSIKNQSYIGSDLEIFDTDGWIDTGDVVEVIDDRIKFKGRLNGSINIGGNKVIPEEVENEIIKVNGVSQVLVRAKSSSIAGSLIEALVVCDTSTDDKKDLVQAIKYHCTSSLPSFKRPAFIRIVKELPMSENGKIKR